MDMEKMTQGDLDQLIACPKRICNKYKMKPVRFFAFYQQDLQLESEDGGYSFKLSIRWQADLAEYFSIDLILKLPDGREAILLALEGRQGGFQASSNQGEETGHIYRLQEEDFNRGAFKYPKRSGQKAPFDDLNGAMAFLQEEAQILGDEKFFSYDLGQASKGKQGLSYEQISFADFLNDWKGGEDGR